MAEEKKKVGKIFPNNFEAEQYLLASILIDGDVASETVGTLKEHDFYTAVHKRIFLAMEELHLTGIPIDFVTVNDKMTLLKYANEQTMSYLVDLSTMLASGANYRQYYDIVKRCSILRLLISGCNSIVEEAYDSSDADRSMRMAEETIYSISQNIDKRAFVHIKETQGELINLLTAAAEDKNILKGISTGFDILDTITNGFRKGDLVLVAARPSVGKTSLALNFVANIAQMAESKKRIALFSLEMPAMQIAQRLSSIMKDIPLKDIIKGDMDASKFKSMWEILNIMGKTEIFIDDNSLITPGDMASKCRRLSSRLGGMDLIVVDYLQLMSTGKKVNEANRQQEISEISRSMKILAKEMQCPVIVISQLSRNVESRKDKSPILSDLRESGAIEQDADIVMFLSRYEEKSKEKEEPVPIKLSIAKHRNGRLGNIRLVWDGSKVKFYEDREQSGCDAPSV